MSVKPASSWRRRRCCAMPSLPLRSGIWIASVKVGPRLSRPPRFTLTCCATSGEFTRTSALWPIPCWTPQGNCPLIAALRRTSLIRQKHFPAKYNPACHSAGAPSKKWPRSTGSGDLPPVDHDEIDVANVNQEAQSLAGDEYRIPPIERVDQQQRATTDRKKPERHWHYAFARTFGCNPLH